MEWIKKLFNKRAEPSLEKMVKYLLDKTVEYGDRDDCAMYLSQYDLPEVEAALIKVATDHTDDEEIIDTAGNSLWEMWQRQGKEPPVDVVEKMHPSAQKFFKNESA